MEYLPAVVAAFALGAATASFLNVVADRVPRGQSILSPPSHCPECGRRLPPLEMVPVISYLALRGRCRECGGHIPVRVPVVEALGGVLFAFAVWRYGVTLDALLAAVLFAFLLLIAIIDLEHKLVLDAVLQVALPIGLLAAPAWSPGARMPALVVDVRYVSLLVDSLIAGLAGFLVFLLLALLSRGGMGAGDVKLAGVLGVWLGLRALPAALLLAVVLGGIVAAVLLVSRSFGRKDTIPFAPFLCGGAVVGVVWGATLGDWYVRLFTG